MMKRLFIFPFYIFLFLIIVGCPSKKDNKEESFEEEDLPYMETDTSLLISSDFRFEDTGLFMKYHGRKNQVVDLNKVSNLKEVTTNSSVKVSYIFTYEGVGLSFFSILMISEKNEKDQWVSYLAIAEKKSDVWTIRDYILADDKEEGINFYIPQEEEGIYLFKRAERIFVNYANDKSKGNKGTVCYIVTTGGKLIATNEYLHGSTSLKEYDIYEINDFIPLEDPGYEYDKISYGRFPFSTRDEKYDLVFRMVKGEDVRKDYLCAVKDGKVDVENALYLTSHIPDPSEDEKGFFNYYSILNDTTIELRAIEQIDSWGMYSEQHYRIDNEGNFYPVKRDANDNFVSGFSDERWTLESFYDHLDPLPLPIKNRDSYNDYMCALPYRFYTKFPPINLNYFGNLRIGRLSGNDSINILLIDGDTYYEEKVYYAALYIFSKDWKKINNFTLSEVMGTEEVYPMSCSFSISEDNVINYRTVKGDILIGDIYLYVDEKGEISEFKEEGRNVTEFDIDEEGMYCVMNFTWSWDGRKWVKDNYTRTEYEAKYPEGNLIKVKGEE